MMDALCTVACLTAVLLLWAVLSFYVVCLAAVAGRDMEVRHE